MKVAIMQPYFLPYIGYFQLINAVDTFVIYDNIEYTKKGWINRNRMLENGKDVLFTLPLKKDSDFLNIDERFLSDDFEHYKKKLLRKIENNYRSAPFFQDCFCLIENILKYDEKNLFYFLVNSIKLILIYLGDKSNIVISSKMNIDFDLKSQHKVIEICKYLKATEYINLSGGINLYNKDDFLENKIKLQFIESNDVVYKQFDNEFVSNLSILDVLMFNSKDRVRELLNEFEIK